MAIMSKQIRYDRLDDLYEYFDGVIMHLIETELDPKRPELQQFTNELGDMLNRLWDLLENVNHRIDEYETRKNTENRLERKIAEMQEQLQKSREETRRKFGDKADAVSQERWDLSGTSESETPNLVWTENEVAGMDDPFESDAVWVSQDDIDNMLVSDDPPESQKSFTPGVAEDGSIDFSTIDATGDLAEDLDDPYIDDHLFEEIRGDMSPALSSSSPAFDEPSSPHDGGTGATPYDDGFPNDGAKNEDDLSIDDFFSDDYDYDYGIPQEPTAPTYDDYDDDDIDDPSDGDAFVDALIGSSRATI